LAGKNTKQSCTIHKVDGTPCISDNETLERWREHIETALNHPVATSSTELDEADTAAATDPLTSVDEPTLDEVVAAIRKLKNGRAPGPDGISAELLKFAIPPVARELHSIFLSVWRTGHVPSDWKDGIIVTLRVKAPRQNAATTDQ